MKRFLVVLLVLAMISSLALAEDGSRESEYARGVTLVEQGAYEEAATVFATVIQHKDAGLYYMYCTAFFALEIGDYPLAEESFALLAEVGFLDSDVMVLYAQARALEAVGSHDEAIALYKEVLVGDSLTRVLDLQRRDAHAGETAQVGSAEDAPDVENVLTVAAIETNAVEIPARAENAGVAPEAVIESFDGVLDTNKSREEYTFVPEHNGNHWFGLSNIPGYYILAVSNADGKEIKSQTVQSGSGYTLNNMVAGERYTVVVRPNSGVKPGPYTLSIGQAVPSVDISGYTAVNGSIRFHYQRNHYTFTPDCDGLYRFGASGLGEGARIDIAIYSPAGTLVKENTFSDNGEGAIASGLVAGETYEVIVGHSQRSAYGEYTLNIGYQSPTQDISEYTAVTDRIAFYGQTNQYMFTPEVSGRYRLSMYGVEEGAYLTITVYTQTGEKLEEKNSIKTGDGITVDGLRASETYRIQVRQSQYSPNTPYQMEIGHQKPTVDITGYTAVQDAMQYAEQRNNYTYTAPEGEDVQIEFTNQPEGMSVGVEVYNQRGERIAEGRSLGNGKSVTFTATAGETYDIRVFQNTATGAYTMRVQ